MEGVQVTVADQCMYGLVTNGVGGQEEPAQKKTQFMTNSPCIAERLLKCRYRQEKKKRRGGMQHAIDISAKIITACKHY